MKTKSHILLVILLTAIFTNPALANTIQSTTPNFAGQRRTFIIAVSPGLSEAQRVNLWKLCGDFLLEKAASGDRVCIFDAWQLRSVADFHIPVDAGHNAKMRVVLMKDEFVRLKSFLSKEDTTSPAKAGHIREPQLLSLLADQWRTPGLAVSVILVGSALYTSGDQETSFDFTDGFYPSDGHLAAKPEESVFSVANRSKGLVGITVHHVGWVGNEFSNELHRQAVTRFWQLWIGKQGGVLATFAEDPALGFQRMEAGIETPFSDEIINLKDSKVQMHKAVIRKATVATDEQWLTGDWSKTAEEPPPKNPVVKELRIGIRWEGPIDIDLHAKVDSDGKELYFAHPRNKDGELVKDFASAPPGIYGFETISFSHPVDIRQVEAAINFYSGENSDGATVEVRVFCDGRCYRRIVKIPATKGNRGEDLGERGRNQCWAVLDLPGIVETKSGELINNR